LIRSGSARLTPTCLRTSVRHPEPANAEHRECPALTAIPAAVPMNLRRCRRGSVLTTVRGTEGRLGECRSWRMELRIKISVVNARKGVAAPDSFRRKPPKRIQASIDPLSIEALSYPLNGGQSHRFGFSPFRLACGVLLTRKAVRPAGLPNPRSLSRLLRAEMTLAS
jgi:hypothetical protein